MVPIYNGSLADCMIESSGEAVIDVEEYQAQTAELVASMEETGERLAALSDNMAELSDSFENFGQLAESTESVSDTEPRERRPVAGD